MSRLQVFVHLSAGVGGALALVLLQWLFRRLYYQDL